jgi:hypothetical protein
MHLKELQRFQFQLQTVDGYYIADACNTIVYRAVFRERLVKQAPESMDTHVTEERCLLRGPCLDVISKGQG